MEKQIVRWIKGQVKDAKAKGIVLGLSGGVDSAVVAALCKKAVGQKNLLALLMPCHSHKQDLEDARLVARKLEIKTKVVELSGIYDNFMKILPVAGNIARVNLKPRLRMLVLYYYANKLNYLVCGTGNKSEIMAGYFTKHGDGAADLLPLGNLLKKQVWTLAKELGIPERVITKPPSAGLWLGQTDEGEMGITYAALDDILERLEKKRGLAPFGEEAGKVKKMIERSEHKRQGPKICYVS